MNKQRRKAIEQAMNLIADARAIIEQVHDEEREAYDNLPESLQMSERGEQMDEFAGILDECMSVLEEQEGELYEIVYA